MSVGRCYLIEALLHFLEMDNVNKSPKKNNPCPPNDAGEEEKKMHVFNVLDRFVQTYILEPTDDEGDDVVGDNDDNYDGKDGVFNYAANLLKSFMVLVDCKDAVASGNGEHLATIQKQMLFHFASVSGYNSYAIEMLIRTLQNQVLLSPAEAHQCKWAALANWKGGKNKNIEIDLLQENRNSDLKGMIRQMGANKTDKAIQRVSKAAGGVRKIIDVFEAQSSIKPKSSAHSHRSATEDEKKMLADLQKLKPFAISPGRYHQTFEGISSDPLENFDEKKFCEWLERRQRNIAMHFPSDDKADDLFDEDNDNT